MTAMASTSMSVSGSASVATPIRVRGGSVVIPSVTEARAMPSTKVASAAASAVGVACNLALDEDDFGAGGHGYLSIEVDGGKAVGIDQDGVPASIRGNARRGTITGRGRTRG